jgi:hypothetical protein
MKNTDSIVDKFVDVLTQEGILISQSKEINWIDSLISILPAKYPPTFMSLVTRYTFDEFNAKNISFFANHGSADSVELINAIPKDKSIFKTTTANGFLQFARPATGSYDPICFDTQKRRNDKECPIVRLNHEEILQFDRIKIIEPLYPSLHEMMTEYIER